MQSYRESLVAQRINKKNKVRKWEERVEGEKGNEVRLKRLLDENSNKLIGKKKELNTLIAT